MLGKFFDPFIFEQLPASSSKANQIYLNEVAKCDIYLGLFGKQYGYKNKKKISPTELEYNEACKYNKTRLIFLSNHPLNKRNPKQQKFVKKIEQEVVRKKFSSDIELKTGVYTALIRYLEQKNLIYSVSFDASNCIFATMDDIDTEKIIEFVRIAKSKRGFPLSIEPSPKKIFTQLNLIRNNEISNSAILLFGKDSQKFIISSEIKCVQFYGNEIIKPIPAYQVYKGDVF